MAEVHRAVSLQVGLEDRIRSLPANAVLRPLARLLDHAFGIAELKGLHAMLPGHLPFWDAALQVLGVEYTIVSGDISRIPRSGPLVVVANHPFGGIDGLILMSLLVQVRTDVKLLGNHLLAGLPELRDTLIPVSVFGNTSKPTMNAAAALAAIRWLRAGGAIAVFPAGEVSHAPPAGEQPLDSMWSAGTGRMVQRSGAEVLPVFFHGRNSARFQLAGQLHPHIRTLLLIRELLNKRGRRIDVSIGSPISAARLARFKMPAELISYARVRTYALATAAPDSARETGAPAQIPIARAESVDGLAREIGALESSHVVLQSGSYDVLLARASEIPRTLLEIGRLREIAFRAAGEGTGGHRDLDRFDRHYLHLFVWNRERREIAGAYRMGATDEIVPRFGTSGLYTSTLFHYDSRLLEHISPAVELGRAFVAPAYQRDYSSLLLLWRGIATFVFNHPRYRMLFGPVSISNSYHSLSRQILARFLHATSYRPDLGELVAPRNPPAFLWHRGSASPVGGPIVRTLADVAALLAELEADQKGVPVLVRQYLKLNARLLGFNVDRAFGDALDGLMLVDLLDVHPAILARYMGAERAEQFRALYGVTAAAGRRQSA